jgi:hypothetical protein
MIDPRITDELRRKVAEAIEREWENTDHGTEWVDHAAVAVFPLIERAVIERLAREAGEPPAHNPNALSQVMRAEAWKRGAAAGVAAERARWKRAISPIEVMCDEEERPDLALIAVGSTLAALLTKGGSDAA